MPADESLPQTSSARHGDASKPYWCSNAANPPGAEWSQEYGYCRTSLDLWSDSYKQGSSDPRCPRACPHKASEEVAAQFQKIYKERGNAEAASFTKEHRRMRDGIDLYNGA